MLHIYSIVHPKERKVAKSKEVLLHRCAAASQTNPAKHDSLPAEIARAEDPGLSVSEGSG
ncbi:hypothetical protein BBI11_04500 [Planococcus maritimus]|nr:hypothetical protein BBI11_04500 [Planococcus maritimus]